MYNKNLVLQITCTMKIIHDPRSLCETFLTEMKPNRCQAKQKIKKPSLEGSDVLIRAV